MTDIEQLKLDKERLDWLEAALRSTGRGDITLHPLDYHMVRTADLIARYEEKEITVTGGGKEWRAHRLLTWPQTEGRAQSLRDAIDAARSNDGGQT